jgi:serine protease Do
MHVSSASFSILSNNPSGPFGVDTGISYVKMTRQLAQYYRLPTTEGVLISNVEPDSPADYAGLRKGDIIESLDGKRIDDTVEISLNLRKKKITDGIMMSVNRYGRHFEVPIQPQNRP